MNYELYFRTIMWYNSNEDSLVHNGGDVKDMFKVGDIVKWCGDEVVIIGLKSPALSYIREKSGREVCMLNEFLFPLEEPTTVTANCGVKYDNNKPKLDLLPIEALNEIAGVLDFGATKYGKSNWKGGIVYSRLCAAALRHIFAFISGETIDPESKKPHLAHAICNLMFVLYFMNEGRAELDDRRE